MRHDPRVGALLLKAQLTNILPIARGGQHSYAGIIGEVYALILSLEAEVVELQEQVAQLQEHIRAREATVSENVLGYIREIAQLRQEIGELQRQQIPSLSHALLLHPASAQVSSSTRLSIDSSVLASWCYFVLSHGSVDQ